MRIRVGTLAICLALSGGACAPPDKPAESKAPATEKKSDAATAKVLFTFTDEKFLRVVYEISNPSTKYRKGLETRWKAMDSDGVIVGSFGGKQPPIPPRSSVIHVGGSGQLTGSAERATLEITDQGALVRTVPKPTFKVGDATFQRSDWDTYDGAQDYEVTAIVTALVDIPTDELEVEFFLRDAEGEIVGAEWASGETGNDIPEDLAKGEKVKLAASVQVENGNVPVTVETALD